MTSVRAVHEPFEIRNGVEPGEHPHVRVQRHCDRVLALLAASAS